MSAVIETFLQCDSGVSEKCIANYGVDNRHLKAYQHRRQAKKEGWLCSNGVDICQECRKVKKVKT